MKDNKVIWLEGMYLQPQHFQQHDRYLESLIHIKTMAVEKNLWGFSRITVDMQLLSIGKIGVLSAKGIFQDGTAFDIPGKDVAPEPFGISEGLHKLTLYLSIPIKQQSAEAGTQCNQQKYRYKVYTHDVVDNTADNHELAQVQMGSLACKILSDQDERSAYHCLPFCKIFKSRSNQPVSLDKSFIPPCLDIRVSNQLSKCITEFHGLLAHRADMLAERLSDTQQANTSEVVDFMLLQLMNRYEAIFRFLDNKSSLHPEKYFYLLIQLMAEMATFICDKRRPLEIPVYEHEQPFETFRPIIKEIQNALSVVLEQNATSIPLSEQSLGLWVGQFPEADLIKNCSFILAVYADLPIENIRTGFPTQVKIAPVEQIRTLVSRQLPGVDLQAIAVAPRQIPFHANFSYFYVNTSHELWKMLGRSAGVAIHVGSQMPGLKLELWGIKE